MPVWVKHWTALCFTPLPQGKEQELQSSFCHSHAPLLQDSMLAGWNAALHFALGTSVLVALARHITARCRVPPPSAHGTVHAVHASARHTQAPRLQSRVVGGCGMPLHLNVSTSLPTDEEQYTCRVCTPSPHSSEQGVYSPARQLYDAHGLALHNRIDSGTEPWSHCGLATIAPVAARHRTSLWLIPPPQAVEREPHVSAAHVHFAPLQDCSVMDTAASFPNDRPCVSATTAFGPLSKGILGGSAAWWGWEWSHPTGAWFPFFS